MADDSTTEEAAPRPVWDTLAFWEDIFTQSPDGLQGRILRIGLYRIVNVNGGWAALEDGANPQLEHVQFPTLQAAVSYCVEAYFLRRLKEEMGGVGYELATMEESK